MRKLNSATNDFIYDLNKYLRIFVSPNELKDYIGDSVNNNRTPSVNQCVRYLRKLGRFELSEKLDTTYKFLNEQGYFNKVRRKKLRDDARDINEYFTVLNNYLIKARPSVKGQFTKIVNKQNIPIFKNENLQIFKSW